MSETLLTTPLTTTGGCHCGAVQFEIDVPRRIEVLDCNCSVCSKTGFLHLIVPETHFRLLKGAGDLTTYTFNTGQAKHLFCKHCGVKSYYKPRSHPGGWSVNLRCVDQSVFDEINIKPFDGRNWEANIAGLKDATE